MENGPVKTPTNKVFLVEWVPSQSWQLKTKMQHKYQCLKNYFFFWGREGGGGVQKLMSCKLRKKCISIKTSELLVMLVKNLLINSFATSTEAWQT